MSTDMISGVVYQDIDATVAHQDVLDHLHLIASRGLHQIIVRFIWIGLIDFIGNGLDL